MSQIHERLAASVIVEGGTTNKQEADIDTVTTVLRHHDSLKNTESMATKLHYGFASSKGRGGEEKGLA